MSTELAKLTATFFYLNELQKLNMVTPSIARPYPKTPIDDERLIYHKCNRKIQQLRMDNIKAQIAVLSMENLSICRKTLLREKQRFRRKIEFYKRKYQPESSVTINARNHSNSHRKRKRTKNSRERYSSRKYRKRLKEFSENPDQRTVVNLSSTDIPLGDLFALEIGHGFVPTPNNKFKEEGTLILEGFRFMDRIGVADSQLSRENRNINRNRESNTSAQVPVSPAVIIATRNDEHVEQFVRDSSVAFKLKSYQPKEMDLSSAATKLVKKEFEELNTVTINSLKMKTNRKFNLPKAARNSIKKLKYLVKDKIIDIRRVDKGQLILIIDYEQRICAEQLNISTIAVLSEAQQSNWAENKEFVEKNLKKLYSEKFVSKEELHAVTGLLAGGVIGTLRNADNSIKFTRALNNSELFAKQTTPYVYPLFKAHKLPKLELLRIPPNEVAARIPSRLVVGMSSCQLSRAQIWLEHLLTPLSIIYGASEHIKDSSDFLKHLEDIKEAGRNEEWDWDNMVLFSVDIKALYPSIKFEFLVLALNHCFDKHTDWSNNVKIHLVELILYTLENQQIYWEHNFYTLRQGIPTGGKHSVPLANILLTFIMIYTFETNNEFKQEFSNIIKIWKRFIDDCFGILDGSINEFQLWFNKLKQVFFTYGLELTCDTESHELVNDTFVEKTTKVLTFLDIDIFKDSGTIHTKEHRKDTSVNSYVSINSAHPRHTFAGIVKSQLFRLRNLCSRNSDFKEAVENLKIRCLRSGYSVNMVQGILSQADALERTLVQNRVNMQENPKICIRLVVLTGTPYEQNYINFAKRMNLILASQKLKIEVVRSTSPTVGQLLFNNNNKSSIIQECRTNNCVVCVNDLQNKSGLLRSTVTGTEYRINNNLTCNEGGIYVINAKCNGQYTGKTISNGNRCQYHFNTNTTAISDHKRDCNQCEGLDSYIVTYVENYLNRGKYSLSEREMLWNTRIKGIINEQKTLRS